MLVKQNRTVTEISRKHYSTAPPRPVQVCAYVRVSTGHEGQMTSMQSQTDYYEHRFSNDPNYVFIGIFSDAGISGAKENRPGFQAMLGTARTGNVDLIYTKSISRFARNTMMLLQVVRELRSIGVGIIFEEQNINTLRSEGELIEVYPLSRTFENVCSVGLATRDMTICTSPIRLPMDECRS